LGTSLCDSAAKAIGIKAHISEQVLKRKTTDQVFGLEDVAYLTGVRMKRTRLPRACTPTLIFVLRPPRERPIASSSLPLFCTGRVLMRPHDGGVDD
jgi:hypothetical protein